MTNPGNDRTAVRLWRWWDTAGLIGLVLAFWLIEQFFGYRYLALLVFPALGLLMAWSFHLGRREQSKNDP
jgi:hypothetical protein